MKKTGVFYGSSTGTCEELWEQLLDMLDMKKVVN
jgi:flavodoxin